MKPIRIIPYTPLRGCDFGQLPIGGMVNMRMNIIVQWEDIKNTLTKTIQLMYETN